MIFQFLLVIALFCIAVYAYFQRRSAPVVALVVALLAFGAMPLVIRPELANRLANLVGIGRGADLLLYCFILISLAAIFNLHLRFRENERRMTAIARGLAIATATVPDQIGQPAQGGRGALETH